MSKYLSQVIAFMIVLTMVSMFVIVGCESAVVSTAAETTAAETTAAETTAVETTAAETTAAETTAVETTAVETTAEPVELKIIKQGHFVPASDKYLETLCNEWADLTGNKVKLEFISGGADEMKSKLAAEINTGSGHDMFMVSNGEQFVFGDSFADVGKYMEEIQAQSGEVMTIGSSWSVVDGTWKVIPFYHQSNPITYRKDYVEAVGYTVDDMKNLTMEGLLDLAKKLLPTGHMVGIPISACGDSQGALLPILWSFGGSLFGENGEVTVNSPETKAALEYVLELCKYMPSGVLAWDASGNNLYMLSGDAAVVVNAPSIYASAKNDKLEFADQIYLSNFPKGVAGSFRTSGQMSWAIPEYSKNKDQAADLIKYMLERENYIYYATLADGYNQPMYASLMDMTLWSENPQIESYQPCTEDRVIQTGWPGPKETYDLATINASARATIQFVEVNMFQQVVSGKGTPEEAMAWAEGEIKRIIEEE